jgi:hypothetical protein
MCEWLVFLRLASLDVVAILTLLGLCAEPAEMSDLALEQFYDQMERWAAFYRVTVVVCAALWLSATLALLLIRRGPSPSDAPCR